MNNKKLKIKIFSNGVVEMQTEGIKGKKCLDYIKTFQELADVKIQSQEFTQEYYEEDVHLELKNYNK